jgi:hypothetical protein
LRKYNHCGGSLKIAAIEDPPVIIKILAHLGLPTRARRRSDSIYSKRPEEPKTGCRREPTEPLALSSSVRCYGTLGAAPTAAPPEPAEATLGFSSTRKTIDIPPVRRYCSVQKKRWFKIPIQNSSEITV